MISSLLAPKWLKLVPFCGLDHKKTQISLVSGNFDVRGSWGQPMFLFWKNIDKTQMSPSPKCATTFFLNLEVIFSWPSWTSKYVISSWNTLYIVLKQKFKKNHQTVAGFYQNSQWWSLPWILSHYCEFWWTSCNSLTSFFEKNLSKCCSYKIKTHSTLQIYSR